MVSIIQLSTSPGSQAGPERAEPLIEKQSAVIGGDDVSLIDAGWMTLVHENTGVAGEPASRRS